jgi:hypothetical protein
MAKKSNDIERRLAYFRELRERLASQGNERGVEACDTAVAELEKQARGGKK